MIYNKTKIICTIGPSSSSISILVKLIKSGMDAARLNFSHGTHEKHAEYIKNIRKAAEITKEHIPIIMDIQGPKIRVGKLKEGYINLKFRDKLYITSKRIIGSGDTISVTYPNFENDVRINELILIDDGKIRLQAMSKGSKRIECRVITGGILKEHKGINLPDTKISLPALTAKDIKDIKFGIEQKLDFIALSFVRSVKDIIKLKKLLERYNYQIPIISKIERPEAIERIDAIINESDAVMVARGDLGIEVPTEQIPILQKMIISKCNKMRKPVITATQMLESMIENPIPTRAETTDIANAILDGTDCVMLSGETSAGKYPEKAVKIMDKIIFATEKIKKPVYLDREKIEHTEDSVLESICNSVSEISERINAKAIVTITKTGKSPLMLSAHRPNSQIIAITHNKELLMRTKIYWGVEPLYINKSPHIEENIKKFRKEIFRKGILRRGDKIILISNFPFKETDSANAIQILKI